MAEKVKDTPRPRRRGHTRISRQHQVTLPIDAMRAAGLREGDQLRASSPAPGIVVLELDVDPLDALAGDMTDMFESGHLDSLRGEWDR